jgi:hypothetical protein
MGINNPIDLLLGEEGEDQARTKYDRNLVGYTQDKAEIKRDREARFLTIEGLLNHPYFININEADISVVIDEFEKLQQPNYDLY